MTSFSRSLLVTMRGGHSPTAPSPRCSTRGTPRPRRGVKEVHYVR